VTDEDRMDAGSEHETLRQRLQRWLAEDERDFEELRETLQITSRDLESALRHVERTVRRAGRRFLVDGPRCIDCRFGFKGRESKHLHTPGRCPRCRGERIDPPRFRIAS
jgi:predicted Zn-ribbon and HTH transcriptional regulator